MRKKGLAPIVSIIIVALIGLAGAGYYVFVKRAPASLVSPLPSSPSSPTAKGCKITGCSGQICASEDVATTCEWREEYACYRTARCERQADGKCGWTMTTELTACLSRAQKPSPSPAVSPISSAKTTPSPQPSPTPSPSPSPSPQVTALTVEADDYGLYPATITVPKGATVRLTFKVRSQNVYYGGLDFRSSKFSTPKVSPDENYTVEFIADSTFGYTSYWPASGVKKADGTVLIQ